MQPATQDQIFHTSDGCPIAYALHGAAGAKKPQLVLIHSLALDSSIWDSVIARLASDAHILTYDCRGHGHSGKPRMSFTVELFARDLAELLTHIGWAGAVVAGCSMGGCVAQAFGALYPSRTTALGLIDTIAWYGEDGPATWRQRAARGRYEGLTGMVDFQTTRWFGDQFRQERTESVEALVRVFLRNDLDSYASTCELLGDADLRPHLPGLRMPVAIVVGEDDYATPVEASRQIHEAISQSTLTIIPKGRHLTPVECPDQIARELRVLLEMVK